MARRGRRNLGDGLMFTLTLADLLVRLLAMLVVSALFAALLAALARLLGDRGPADDGRLTLNPFEHVDVLAAIPFVLFETGWIRPMAIDPRRLRPHPVLGAFAAVLFALALTLGIVLLVWNLRRYGQTALGDATAVATIELSLRTVLDVAVWFALLNLLPLSPLAAGHVIEAVVPRASALITRYSLLVRIAIIAALLTGWPQTATRPARTALMDLFGVPI